ncbi:hypothetical protein D3C72_1686780 [compost metagenome]
MPSRNTASALAPAPDWKSLEDLAIRWVSMVNWLAAAISAVGAPCCSFRLTTASLSSSRFCVFLWMACKALLIEMSASFCLMITSLLAAVRLASSTRGSSVSAYESDKALMPSSSSPDFRPSTFCLRTVELSATSANDCSWPLSA